MYSCTVQKTQIIFLNIVQVWIFAFNVFVSWIKIFKYISFNKTMHILSETLARFSAM